MNVPAGSTECRGYQSAQSLTSADGRTQPHKRPCKGKKRGVNPGYSRKRRSERGHHGEGGGYLGSPFGADCISQAAAPPFYIMADTPPTPPPIMATSGPPLQLSTTTRHLNGFARCLRIYCNGRVAPWPFWAICQTGNREKRGTAGSSQSDNFPAW